MLNAYCADKALKTTSKRACLSQIKKHKASEITGDELNVHL